jgi:hypothetical protein
VSDVADCGEQKISLIEKLLRLVPDDFERFLDLLNNAQKALGGTAFFVWFFSTAPTPSGPKQT